MSLLLKVAEAVQVSTAEVLRVANGDGETDSDWVIAHAIEAAGGRSAYELMFTAGREQMIAEIWGDSGAPAEVPAPTNPRAVHDPEVVIYAENTSPDAAPTALPDHPNETDDEPVDEVEIDPGRAAWNTLLHTHVWADVAALTDGAPDEIARTVRPWSTARDAITAMTMLVIRHRAAHTSSHSTIAAALTA